MMKNSDMFDFRTYPYLVQNTVWDDADVSNILIIFTALSGKKQAILDINVFDSFGDPILFAHPKNYSTSTKRLALNGAEDPDEYNSDFNEFGAWLAEYVEDTKDNFEWAIVTLGIYEDDDTGLDAPLVEIKWMVDEGQVELIESYSDTE